MADDILLVDVDDRVAVVTLNRPEARNALSRDLIDAILTTVAGLDADESIDAVILTGADPAFSAGLDLRSLSGDPAAGRPLRLAELPSDLFESVRTPVIAAVNGVAVTGGLELVLACDFVVASEQARFADTHARLAFLPGWGLGVRLTEAVGTRRAREMSITGNYVDAGTALAWGLVNHVVPHEELLPFARSLAADIVSNDPEGVRGLLDMYDRETAMATGDALADEAARFREWIAAGGGTPEDVARRRAALEARGRAQQGR
jgi:enoyl-CoA hydratase